MKAEAVGKDVNLKQETWVKCLALPVNNGSNNLEDMSLLLLGT